MSDARVKRLRFGYRPIDLPGSSSDLGFEAQAANNLFERGVIAFGRDRLRGDDDFCGVRNVGAVHAAKAQARLRQRVQ